MKIIAPTISTFLFLTTLRAQDSLQLSLGQAIEFGLANNKNIQAGALEATLTGYTINEYRAGLYPVVNGNAGVTHYVDVPAQYARANTFDPTAPSDKFTGFKLLLPNSANAGLSADWLLYDQAVYSAIKLAKESSRLTDIQYQKDKSDLAFTISELYYAIIFARKQQESLLKVDSNTTRLVEILQVQFDNGLIKRSDLDRVKVNKLSIASRIDQLNSAITTQVNLLKLLLGLYEPTRIKLTEPDIDQLLVPVTEVADPGNNFDVRLIQEQITISKLQRKTIVAGYFPSLSANYNYSYNWVSTDFSKVFRSDLKFPQQYIGLNLSVSIFDGNRKLYKTRENMVATRQLELKAGFLLDKTNTDIRNALLGYNTSLRNVDANSSNVDLGEKLYAESLYEYQQGTISLNDVITTENTLQQALNAYFGSVSTAFATLLEYRKATNTILTTK